MVLEGEVCNSPSNSNENKWKGERGIKVTEVKRNI
jgi:hypothetical protein